MVNFTIDQVRRMMDRKRNIRNISVIAHVDHGKSTLTDSLISKAGIIARAKSGETRFMDTRGDEKEKAITIKSTSVSLYYERTEGESQERVPYLINLIDSPGHVDFSSEVTAALRVTDGALVVVDCIEGVCVQTETVLRQAIQERIRPILFLNKLDRVFLELQWGLEECYKSFRNSIESVNVIGATYTDESLGSTEMVPQTGRVGFGSGLHAWGFTLNDFAKMYAAKFGVSPERMMDKLWGENYWDPKGQMWVKKNNETNGLQRGFCQFILHPIKTLFDSIMAGEEAVYEPIVKSLNLSFSKKDLQDASKRRKDYLKLVMRTWIPAGDALLDMIADHLPSPAIAQRYRVDNLYSGPMDSAEAIAVRNCDASVDAPMSMYVAKMVPTSDKGRFIAFGRVFSGTVKTGQEVRILGPGYEMGGKSDLHVKRVKRTVLMMGRYVERIQDCPAGNVCGLIGIDQFLQKSGTITDSAEFHPFVSMKFSVAAVVQVAVECQKASDLPKLVEGLKRLDQSDPLVKIFTSKTGEHIIAGAGELHLEVCLKDLREDFMKDASIVISEPVVSFAETISSRTENPAKCLAKSPNKLNRIWMDAQPMSGHLVDAVESGQISLQQSNAKVFAQRMRAEFGWNSDDARKVWTFGCPPDALANTLVDMTKGVQYVSEIKDSLVSAFMECTENGVLCGEIMRGIRFNLNDLKIHSDPSHRGAGQIIPCARKAFYACQLASTPKLLEPMYLVDIVVPTDIQSGVFSTLNPRRGYVETISERPGTPLSHLQAFLPVMESFGFTQALRKNTGGKAFPQMKFSHWQLVSGDPLKEGSHAHRILAKTRKRKGLKDDLPVLSDYNDRL